MDIRLQLRHKTLLFQLHISSDGYSQGKVQLFQLHYGYDTNLFFFNSHISSEGYGQGKVQLFQLHYGYDT